MDHVAQRRQLDQQDVLKVAAAEVVSWHGWFLSDETARHGRSRAS
jgi:hypothetical protein